MRISILQSNPPSPCWSLSQRLSSDSPFPPLPQICATALPPVILIRAADRGEAAAAWRLPSKTRPFFSGGCWDFSGPVKGSLRLPVGLVIRPSLEVVGSLQFLPARLAGSEPSTVFCLVTSGFGEDVSGKADWFWRISFGICLFLIASALNFRSQRFILDEDDGFFWYQ